MAIKLTQEQLLTVYKAATGQDVEVVESNETFDIDTELSVIDNNRKQFIASGVTDEEKELIKKSVTGQMTGKMLSDLKKATGYDGKGKHTEWEDALKAAVDHVKNLSGGEKEDFLKQMNELTAAKDLEREQAIQELQTELQSTKKKNLDRDAIETLRQEIKEMQLEGDKNVLASDLYNALQNEVAVNYDENGKALQFFDKQSGTIPAKNKAGTRSFDVKEFAKDYFTVRGNLRTDMRTKNPAEEMAKRGAGEQKPFAPSTKPSGLGELQQQLDAMQA